MPQIGQAALVDAFRATDSIPDDAFAIWRDGSELVAELYLDGFRLDVEVGRIALPQAGAGLTDWSVIRHDPLGNVADGAILWRHDDGDDRFEAINVWDLHAGTPATHSITAPAGTGLSAPVYLDGWIYWLENDLAFGAGSTFVARLNRARADFSDPEFLWELGFDTPDGSDFTKGQVQLLRVTEASVRFVAQLFHGETGVETVEVGVELAGSAPSFPADPPTYQDMRGIGIPNASGCVFALAAAAGVDTSPYFWSEADSPTAAPVAVWPDPTITPSWVTGWGSIRSAGVNAAGTKAMLYGVTSAPAGLAIEASAVSSAGFRSITVEEHPDLGFPLAYFHSR